MAAVFAEGLGESLILVGEGGMIVYINDIVRLGVGFQAFVDVDDGLAGVSDFCSPNELRAWRYGADNGYDTIGLGKLAHGDDVVNH